MATVDVDEHGVTVALTVWERPFCGGRSRLVVPWSEVRCLERMDRPTRVSATGVGHSGLLVTGVLKLGRWGVGSPTRRFVSVRRWVPAVRVRVTERFRGQLGYDELLISTPDVDRITAAPVMPR